MGLLASEAFRAARMVIDAGVPAKGWTREQALQYLMGPTVLPPSVAEGETDRYISWPRQAPSYMLGRTEIMRLRETGAYGTRREVRHSRVSRQVMALSDRYRIERELGVYVPGSESDLVRVSRDGQVRVLREARRRYHSPKISPDGKRIAYDDVSSEGRDIWIYSETTRDVQRATVQRDGHDAVWSLDGRGLDYFASNGKQLDRFHIQPGTTARPVAESTSVEIAHTGTTLRDSSYLTTVAGTVGRGLDIVRISPQKTVERLVATDADESFVVPSPDNRWFAYVSDQSGRPEVYLRALGGSDVQLQISVDGATEPVWSRDGSEIYFRAGSMLVAAKLQLGTQPSVTARTALFDVSGFDAAAPHANYDVSPDGSWFVFARRGGTNHIVVLQNVSELARRIARGAGNVP